MSERNPDSGQRFLDCDGKPFVLFPTDYLDLVINGKPVPFLSIEPDGTPKVLVPTSPATLSVDL